MGNRWHFAPAINSLARMGRGLTILALLSLIGAAPPATTVEAQVAVRGQTIYTMAGPPINQGVVLIRNGKIAVIGSVGDVVIPDDFRVLEAEVVTPGLIDAHSTVGLSGIFNVAHDQDQLERSSPVQPELRAVDAYNAQEELIAWIRSFGVTTVHTGHGPGELISGQTIVVKTSGATVEAATMVPSCAVAATLGSVALKNEQQSPGTRAKMIAMLRSQFIEAEEYREKRAAATDAADTNAANTNADKTDADNHQNDDLTESDAEQEPDARDLRMETLVRVLDGKLPMLITAHRAQDIANALRLAAEFDILFWLDGGAESYLLIDELKAADVPVIVHPLMARPAGDLRNMSFETPAKLLEAGIVVVFQSGYEAYVPKTRVVLFEAAMAAANGLSREQALAGITREPAKLLGVDNRVGTLEIGKDGDLALFDGDPFEYTTHCTGTVIEGHVVSDAIR